MATRAEEVRLLRDVRRFEAESALISGRIRSTASLIDIIHAIEGLRIRPELRTNDRVRDERARLARVAEGQANAIVNVEVERIKAINDPRDRDERFSALARSINRLRGLLSNSAVNRSAATLEEARPGDAIAAARRPVSSIDVAEEPSAAG